MKKNLFFKALTIGVLMLLIMFALAAVGNTISERAARRDSVEHDIARSSAGPQTLSGPLLMLPYTRSKIVETKDDKGQIRRQTVIEEDAVWIFPKQLDIRGQLNTEVRKRGIFEALLFHTDLTLVGQFELGPQTNLAHLDDEKITWKQPNILVGLDNQGIRATPTLALDNQPYMFKPGTADLYPGDGIHADIPLDLGQSHKLAFTIHLSLNGSKSFSWLPSGENTHVSLTSPWPHPSFVGATLPLQHKITEQGFTAEWQTSHFASNLPQHFMNSLKNKNMQEFYADASGVNLITPVDVYQQTERSVKYGFLFVMLTFAAFGLFEILKRLPIHPVQYALVGVALALFFLLLLALSEHLTFWLSYLIAAGGCVSLIGFYLSHVLHTPWRGLAFSGWLTLLYGALYCLLVSEDNALLMGALLLFSLLAGIMILTRKINWYQLDSDPAPARPVPAAPGVPD